MRANLRKAAAVPLAVLLLTGCSPDDGRHSPRGNALQGDQSVGDYHGGGDRDREPDVDHVDHVVSAPLGDRDAAAFHLLSGASTMTVRITDLGDQLYRIATPDGSKLAPSVRDETDVVALSLVETGLAGPEAVDVQLNREVRWQIRISGGADDQILDLGAGSLSAVELLGGVSRIQLTMPPARSTLAVRMTGGAGQVTVIAPGGQPARVTFGSGAGSAVVDGSTKAGIGGGTVMESKEWAQASDRYDFQMLAGLSTFVLERR